MSSRPSTTRWMPIPCPSRVLLASRIVGSKPPPTRPTTPRRRGRRCCIRCVRFFLRAVPLDLERPALCARAQEASVDASDGGLGHSGHFIDESDGESRTLAAVGDLPCRADLEADIGHVLRLTLPLVDGARLRLLVARQKGGAPFEAREQAFAEQVVRHIERARQFGSSSHDPGPCVCARLEARGALPCSWTFRRGLSRSISDLRCRRRLPMAPGKAIAFEQRQAV